ncbi:hypothetical protein AU184_22385 [Mycolicibacterium novocastrense]|uniref:Uncharacterized protein n=1 Tax=Mycolicibacterium novocastrense TaxID=59813 RepID=A0AAW5SU08_MYCNV|nr:hypothetical protein [Mycolicibacterium novocastrense]KUH65398.1 hypothetical protein AU183_21270 [Mycolicibacterium novocastrense]KUH75592.1 hypothetical protein AU072_21115 [Mycolicibacterium novocastrense]KUH77903.1 hypothetical protein AU184_22385 [Mycolicibacterium novocastrense]MCV7027030.1 hypothetical protein [Mycolicibacterium novocastrense]GAT08735.1 uncharacterized protein RMCN_1868 [Mycolicibacterium novocastrense]
MIVWVIAGLLGLATGLRIGWALVNKQSLVSTAMIVALASLALIAALNWQPLTLLIDRLLRWPNISLGLSQVALVACAAGSCVMITTVSSVRKPATIRKIAFAQYSVAAVIAVVTGVAFFSAGRQPEMSPQEYLQRNLSGGGNTLPWLLPLLYVLLALSLVSWAGLRYSNRSRRGRALFVFTIGIVLIVVASAFFFLRALDRDGPVGVGAAATLLGCAMLVVAAGSLLPSIEDWFGARRELRAIQPILTELGRRHPDIGIGVRPRGPLVFRVAERMSLISDALYLEATAAEHRRRLRVDPRGAVSGDDADADETDLESPPVPPREQARAIAQWIHSGTEGAPEDRRVDFPGLGWLNQPSEYSDREWILEIAEQYRALTRRGGATGQAA